MFFFRFLSMIILVFFFQAEDGIRDLVRSRGLGDVYKRQLLDRLMQATAHQVVNILLRSPLHHGTHRSADDNGRLAANAHDRIDSLPRRKGCLLYTSDAADERSSVDLGGRRIIQKKK